MTWTKKEVASMDCKEAKGYIHEYMDGQLDGTRTRFLLQHVRDCSQCERKMAALEKTEALIRTLRPIAAPDGMKDKIMASIPQERRRSTWMRWIKQNPAVSVAVVFLMVMVSSLFSLWDQDQTLAVKGDDLDQVVIQGKEVIVPEGSTVHGDLTVENGSLQVFGEVQGNLVIIDGSVLQASTAQISGDIVNVNQTIDWIWYKVSSFFGSLTYE
jgi:anti-sigma factor RsiW